MTHNKAWIILLWGAPAAGKSTLARRIAEHYEQRWGHPLCHLGTDRMNQAVLGDAFDPLIRTSLYHGILSLAENLLASGRPVLIEGTFLDDAWRVKLEALSERLAVKLLSVQVECRLALRESRNECRLEKERVPTEYLQQCHHLAQNQAGDADYVFDTELLQAEGLAQFLLGATREAKT